MHKSSRKPWFFKKDSQIITNEYLSGTLRGRKDHGIVSLPKIFKKVKDRKINPRPQAKIVRKGQACFLIDGDGSNDPRELLKMNKLIEMGNAEVVLGSRTMGKREPEGKKNRSIPFRPGRSDCVKISQRQRGGRGEV